MKFNDIIRHAMRETNTTQVQLGERLGIRQTAVSSTVVRPNITLAKFVTIMQLMGYEIVVRKGDEELTITNE